MVPSRDVIAIANACQHNIICQHHCSYAGLASVDQRMA
jgi:hypothetical protein